ncbi:MAG: GNAT family N-acetyltransferase [Dysgonamonadaceae bacterium]|jgi:GNAT superfamily N-acetyltransferase|nr:GNAT family N-acetyltransferase [Dysgonamonadaceae bacterium]
MTENTIEILIAEEKHIPYIPLILQTIKNAAKIRGTGIASRSPEYIKRKMIEGKAVIALSGEEFAGFTYIESWGNKQFVATSGLIVAEKFRGSGIARRIKLKAFNLARKRWANAKLFSLTSGSAVMKMNTELGYVPVTFEELTDDDTFWLSCKECINYDILERTNRKYCICTAMLWDPAKE